MKRKASTEKWRVLGLMTGAQAGSSVVQQALGSLSPLLVATLALSHAQLGMIFSAILLGAMAFTAITGLLTDRWGERRMLLISATVMVAALLAAGLRANYAWLLTMFAIYGAGYAASTPAGGRAILAWFTHDRGLAMGIRQTGVSVGALIGALTLPLVASAYGYRAAFAFAAVLVAVPSALAFWLYHEPPGDRGAAHSWSRAARDMVALARDPRLVAVTLTCMLLSAVQFIMNAFLTVTAVHVVQTPVRTGALALAGAFFAATCGRLGWGLVSDRLFGGDRLVPLALVCLLAASAAGILAGLRPGQSGLLLGAAFLLGLTAAGWNGLMAAALSEVGGLERAASALGVGLTFIFASSAAGPTAFGFVADRASLGVAWALAAGACVVATVPVLWLRVHRAAPQPGHRCPTIAE